MQGNRRVDTSPERRLRSALQRRGLRFRKDFPIVAGESRVRADVVFPARRLAVFVDGCYWHGCPEHCRVPTRNATYWQAKIDRNMRRDERVGAALAAAGWHVLRVWEHVDADAAAAEVATALRRSDK
jgi:DNA mismatch endonuclease, patch repair protein